MKFNYQLRPYRAMCMQWDGKNAEEICAVIDTASVFRDIYIMIRHSGGVNTLSIGDWVIKGEDGELRFYKRDIFPLKYQSIPAA